jgi:hypothetical protein
MLNQSFKDLRVVENGSLPRVFNRLLDKLDAMRLEVVSPLSLERGQICQVLSIGRQPSGGGGGGSAVVAAAGIPFTPTISGATISFYPGVINGLVPQYQFDGNANTAFTLLDGINYCMLSAATNGQQVMAVNYVLSATPPAAISTTMGACPASFEWLLAIAAGTVADGFSLLYSSVGNVIAQPKQVFVSAKASPQYGLEAIDRWFSWQVWQLVNL